ncbi:50S ribosomal protein L19-2, chloroplastic [Hevea brasiliensis]|uniref:50S ribosomal protein L19-2, chloroplastic n=1 Tax=Hevea brasiliensis TaxID=3981 RepID=UPI0025D42695|nr:50S ribosomal protein L19-2, chloroplastic [Hevea brasiliensis]
MGSKILSQALVVIPRSPTLCLPPRKLGFSSTFHRDSTLCISTSRVSSNSICSNLEAFARHSIVARAESENSGGGEVANESDNVEGEVTEVEEQEEKEGEVVLESDEVKAEVKVKEPRKPIIKLGDIMGILNKRAVEASEKERPIPDIRTGDIVEIKLEVPENRRRLSIYKGIVMSRQNAGIHTTIRVRRIIAGIGVEIVFPLYSPNIKEIKVVKHRKVRRARLYYLREKLPRLSTFK